MNLLCLVFGHKSLQGIYSGAEYMRVAPGAIDGIGREHARLYATCPRCEREYSAGAIHLPPRVLERGLLKKLDEAAAQPHAGESSAAADQSFLRAMLLESRPYLANSPNGKRLIARLEAALSSAPAEAVGARHQALEGNPS